MGLLARELNAAATRPDNNESPRFQLGTAAKLVRGLRLVAKEHGTDDIAKPRCRPYEVFTTSVWSAEFDAECEAAREASIGSMRKVTLMKDGVWTGEAGLAQICAVPQR